MPDIHLDLPMAKYGRNKKVSFIQISKCDNCKEEKVRGIHVDHSDGEYGSVQICNRCLLENIEKSK